MMPLAFWSSSVGSSASRVHLIYFHFDYLKKHVTLQEASLLTDVTMEHKTKTVPSKIVLGLLI